MRHRLHPARGGLRPLGRVFKVVDDEQVSFLASIESFSKEDQHSVSVMIDKSGEVIMVVLFGCCGGW